MAPLLILLYGGFIWGISSDAYKEYAAHSNGNASFQITFKRPCDKGLKESGYALSLSNLVIFKQRNHDGSVGDICTNEPSSQK